MIDIIPNSKDAGGRLVLDDALEFSYSAAETDPATGKIIEYLADGVGVVMGDMNPAKDEHGDDFFFADPKYVRPLFDPAFVEYFDSPNKVPYVPYLSSFDNSDDDQIRLLMNRWNEHGGKDNHQYVAGGTRIANPSGIRETGKRGDTSASGGNVYSLLCVEQIEGVLRTSRSLEALAEMTAHEIAHQWHVDPHPRDRGPIETEHDDYIQWNKPGAHCLMLANWSMPCHGSICPEYFDKEVGFHYMKVDGKIDSEYIWIRQRCEPIPLEYPAVSSTWWADSRPCR